MNDAPGIARLDPTLLTTLAHQVGLDAVGVAAVQRPPHAEFYLRWLQNQQHGEMHYMESRAPLRLDPEQLLPGAKSLICFAWNYHLPDLEKKRPAGNGKIARYALGDDYHPLFKERLQKFWKLLMQHVATPAKARVFSDSAPIMERDFAALAGIGWIGKNSCLINPKLGSWLLLGEILTDLELTVTNPMNEHCGTCTACLDACPTNALVAPYTLDSRLCISYLTIEKQTTLTDGERRLLQEHLFGCDICQEVCPWNRRAPAGSFLADKLRPELLVGNLETLRPQSVEGFEQQFAGNPILRAGYDGWLENLAAVQENLTAHAHPDPDDAGQA